MWPLIENLCCRFQILGWYAALDLLGLLQLLNSFITRKPSFIQIAGIDIWYRCSPRQISIVHPYKLLIVNGFGHVVVFWFQRSPILRLQNLGLMHEINICRDTILTSLITILMDVVISQVLVDIVVLLRNLIRLNLNFNITLTYERLLWSFIVLCLSFCKKIVGLCMGHRSLRCINLVSVLNCRNPDFAGDWSTLTLQLLDLGNLVLWFRILCSWPTFLSSLGTLLFLGGQLFATIGCFRSKNWLGQILTGKHLLIRRIPWHLKMLIVLWSWPLLLAYVLEVCHYVIHLFFIPLLKIVWTHALWIQHYSLLAWFHYLNFFIIFII